MQVKIAARPAGERSRDGRDLPVLDEAGEAPIGAEDVSYIKLIAEQDSRPRISGPGAAP